MKELVGLRTPDFAAHFNWFADYPISLLNVDLSTVTAATDVVIGAGNPMTEITDLNLQSGPDPKLENRILLYNAILRFRYNLPVRSILMLLRPKADRGNLTGSLVYQCGYCRVEFRYEVIRVWEHSSEAYMSAGLGILPLAVLGKLPDNVNEIEGLRSLVGRIETRLLADTTPENAARLMMATFNLTLLRVAFSTRADIFRGVGIMKTGYDELAEAEFKVLKRTLLRQGNHRFGLPSSEIESAIRAIEDFDRLERMCDAVLTVCSWQELIETP